MSRIWRVLSVLIVCIVAGCRGEENSSCRALFEEHYETNIQAFIRTMPDADSIEARRRGARMLDKLYEIDSTFVRMQGKELDAFIRENLPLLRACDSVRQINFRAKYAE